MLSDLHFVVISKKISCVNNSFISLGWIQAIKYFYLYYIHQRNMKDIA